MNTLSWFIYGVHLVASLNLVLAFVLVVLFVVGALKVIGATEKTEYKRVQNSEKVWDYDLKQVVTGDRITWSLSTILILWFSIVTVDVFIPSRQTLLLIAASEYGEKIANNEKVGQLVDPSLDLIKVWIEKEKKHIVDSMNNTNGEKK